MKICSLVLFLALFTVIDAPAQKEKEPCTIEIELKHTPVISQGSTGTCWSFATTSFLESEIMRKGFPETDLSEMYFVWNSYINRAKDYLLYHGKNNFGQGGQAHDVLDVLREKGMVTNEAFPGKKVDGRFRHRDLVNELNIAVTDLNKKSKDFDVNDVISLGGILKDQIGKLPKKVKTKNGNYTPAEFRDKFGLNPDDYVEISSYTHHPFYKPFVLEVPDNWAHECYYNLPIDELVETIEYSLKQGYTVCWDGDTSEKTFSHSKGLADVPKNQIGKIDQEMRQETFFDRTTTDDHLMHVVGLSKAPDGRTCFYTKNSWGTDSNHFGGYLHLTNDYVRLKTIAIVVNKEAIPPQIKAKLNL
jgi:bleomycin hydrolase